MTERDAFVISVTVLVTSMVGASDSIRQTLTYWAVFFVAMFGIAKVFG